MNANADRFPLATNWMTYVAGRLTGKAYALMLPKIKYGIPQFVDFPQMLEYLEKAFGDPDRTQNAQNKLFQWKQKNQDFSAYLSEFQRLALEAEMPESALVPLLFQGISRELQDMLLHNPAPSLEYTAYTNHLQTLDNRYRQHQQQVSRNRTSLPARAANVNHATTITRPTTASFEPAKRPHSPRAAPSSPIATFEPMDLSSQRAAAPSGRRERGECFRCGSKDHRVAHCPHPDTRQFLQARSNQLYRPVSPPTPCSASPPASITGSLNGVSLN